MAAATRENVQAKNQGVIKVIPVILAALLIYASYVIIGPLTVDHLLTNKNHYGQIQYSKATGIAIPTVYFVLIIFMVASYLRILSVVWQDPGFVPEGYYPPRLPQTSPDPERGCKRSSSSSSSSSPQSQENCCSALASPQDDSRSTEKERWPLEIPSILLQRIPPPPGTEDFYTRDVFVCDINGLPKWCGTCCNWKPDRTHHCSNSGRCVRKMDHFCPWVGGTVGESSYKFFVQFTFYAALFTCYLLILLAYFVAENVAARSENSMVPLQVQYIVVLAICGFFCLFTLGMVVMTVQMVFQNRTTIESQSPNTRRMYLAIALPPHLQSSSPTPPPQAHRGASHPRLRMVPGLLERTITYPLCLPTNRPPLPAPHRREFAIVHTPEGLHPWDLGVKENWCAVMGRRPQDWFFPLRRSPPRHGGDGVSEYPMGWQFTGLLREIGFL
ncbi:zf-DHHC-domain-containing protein [Polychaeton citri CBS 116435]|uniref:Palmitoyltransferase n=1 Tax=Polychaeton citri CBS 116435 TaxID=1314669 RepID=A0A9P4QI95_9PEZI|nr:zf-DHHC-domain-containing protein [Polychaeton citri CBS 116435]